MNLRSSAYQPEHDASTRRGRDRVRGKPTNLRTLLRWLTREYALEAPAKLHSGAALEEDGDPAMTGEASAWLGFHQDSANDWVQVACGTDKDGFYRTPLRCAIARIHQQERRNLLSELAVNLLFPKDVMNANGIPGWAQNDVMAASLSMLWDQYSDRPLPTVDRNRSPIGWTEKSQAQRDAEDAA